jgi:hypothetical protein
VRERERERERDRVSERERQREIERGRGRERRRGRKAWREREEGGTRERGREGERARAFSSSTRASHRINQPPNAKKKKTHLSEKRGSKRQQRSAPLRNFFPFREKNPYNLNSKTLNNNTK